MSSFPEATGPAQPFLNLYLVGYRAVWHKLQIVYLSILSPGLDG